MNIVEARVRLIEEIAEYLHDSYRGGPGDLNHPSKRWNQLDDRDKQGWLGDADDIISIVASSAWIGG